MKKLVLILLVMFFGCFSQKAIAYDFSAVNDYGDTIYYRITSDSTVKVTYEGRIDSRGNYYGKVYSGDIIIPPSVINNGITYKVNSIGVAAFRQFEILSVTMPETILSIEESAFLNCQRLKSITIPSSTIKIGSRAFEYCIGLKSVYIPNLVTSIGGNAFFGCINLDTLILGSSVNLIGQSAFFYALNLIISNPTNPPIIYEGTFGNYSASVFVPCESLESYQSALYWSKFNYIQCIGLDDIPLESFKINAYPNPAKDNITIKIDDFSKGLVFIYDIMGKEVLSKQISSNKTIIDVSRLNSGVYIIKFHSQDNKLIGNSKLIKQ